MIAPHLVQYQGSKRTIAPEIIKYFPPNVERLIEPFAGTCAVSILAAMKGKAKNFWLNDINEPLISMMKCCIEQPDRELGIPLVTLYDKDSEGDPMAVYVFGDWKVAKKSNHFSKTGGRTQLTDKLKRKLIERYGSKCNLYGEEYPEKFLQPDHRIPYEIGGDPEDIMNTDSISQVKRKDGLI